jgi:hypothetical protein
MSFRACVSEKRAKFFGWIALFLLLSSCDGSQYDGVELPDINAESFSYEEMMNKKNLLEKRVKSAKMAMKNSQPQDNQGD